MNLEKATGLFHKAIAQSGSLRSTMTKYFKENPVYAHLRIKWALESDEDVRSKAKTLTGRNLKISFV